MSIISDAVYKSDYNDIEAVCIKSNNLFETIGDCGDEYR